MSKPTPFLTFNNQAEEAVNFYASLFKDSKIHTIVKAPDNNTVLHASFELDGQHFMAMDGGEYFRFEQGFSIFVDTADQDETDHYYDTLVKDGGEAMSCGWVKDRFGISWQIVPRALGQYMQDPDHEKAGRVMQAMLKMQKIIVEDLDKAYKGE